MQRRSIAVLVAVMMLTMPASAMAARPSVPDATAGPSALSATLAPSAVVDMGALPASPVSGAIATQYDEQTYTIDLTAGEVLDVELAGPVASDFDVVLYTEGPEGPEVVAESAGAESDEAFRVGVPVTAEYVLAVVSYMGAGSYTLTWSRSAGEPDDTLPGVPLAASPVFGSFSSGDVPDDFYSVYLTAGQVLFLTMDVPETADFDVELYRPGTTWIDLSWGSDAISGSPTGFDEEIVFRARQSGDHYIRVEAWDGEGPYTLRWHTAAGPEVSRIAGSGRIETAIEASREGFESGASAAIIATARDWPDALGGSALSMLLGGPMLLTEPGFLPAAVADEIERLGASEVIILGGTGAVSADVADALAEVPGVSSVDRISGANRYATAEAIAARVTDELTDRGLDADTAFVATGEAFPDALAASPIASQYALPIYLVPPQADRHQALVDTIEAAGATQTFILGGTGAVPASFESALVSAFGSDMVLRLAGDDRYTTAVEVADFAVGRFGFEFDRVAVATGQDFPDALAAGPMQASANSILLLSHTAYLDEPVASFLQAYASKIAEARVVGGTGALSETVRLGIVDALAIEH